jgi:hypothetical protein
MPRESPEEARDARERVHEKGNVGFGLALLVLGIMAVVIGFAMMRGY